MGLFFILFLFLLGMQSLRELGSDVHFFNGELAERHKMGLGYLIRASLQAHAKLAPVARGAGSDVRTNSQHPEDLASWPQRRDDPNWWWWHAYFAPRPNHSSDG